MHFSDQKTSQNGRYLHRFLFLLSLFFFGANAYSAPKTILVLGDSLSAEYGLERGTGWVALLEKRLAENRKDFSVVNASVSGDTTSGGGVRLQTLLKQHSPQILIIELGGNDGLRGLPTDTIKKNLRAMVTAARRADCRVLLLGMQIPPNYGKTYAAQFARIYEQVAAETNMVLVPFFLKGVAENDALFQPDRVHPTRDAQPILLENVWRYLMPMLK